MRYSRAGLLGAAVLVLGAFAAATKAISTLTADVRIQSDSLRMEACRGGVLVGKTCTGRKQAPRVSVMRVLADRFDSIAVAWDNPPPPPAPTLSLTASDSVLRVAPNVPSVIRVVARGDSATTTVDSVALTLSDPTKASLRFNAAARVFEVYAAAAPGPVMLTGHYGSATASVVLRVEMPPPPPPPAPTLVLTLNNPGDTVLRVRPIVPYIILLAVRGDSAGVLLSDSARFSVNDTTLAKFYWLAGQRRFQISDAAKSGTLVVTARWGSAVASLNFRVDVPVAPPPITWNVTLTTTDTVLQVQPVFFSVRVDSNGVPVRDSAQVTFSDATLASISWLPAQRRWQVSEAVKAGTLVATGTFAGASASTSIRVAVTPPPLGALVQVNTGATFQTMRGWETAANDYWLDCKVPGAYDRYRAEVHRRAIEELGLTVIGAALHTGAENTVDYYSRYRASGVMLDWTAEWHRPVNDNADPFVTDSSKYHFRSLFEMMDTVTVPLRARILARGEVPTIVVTVVDFNSSGAARPMEMLQSPEEYAEFVTMAFVKMQQRYGWVPDALEASLEPEHSAVYGAQLGAAIAAARARLASRGFHPEIWGPSTTAAYNVGPYVRAMSGAGRPDLVTYHRYISPPASDSILRDIASHGLPTAMSEYNEGTTGDSLFALLLKDVTLAQVGQWKQFTLAGCGKQNNPLNKGVYFQVDVTDSLNPVVRLTHFSKLFRQLFPYVRRGAVRVGAVSGSATLQAMAFRATNGRVTTVVRALNAGTFGIDGLPSGNYGVNYALVDGSVWNVEQPLQSIGAGGRLSVTLPARGVVTVYGLSAPPPPVDTTPPPPTITWKVTLTPTDDTLRVRPLAPYYIFVTARVDSNGVTVRDSVPFTTSDTSLASIWWNSTARHLEVYDARGSGGNITVTGRWGSVSAQVQIRVEVAATPPPDTTPPPLPPPASGAELPRLTPTVPAGLDARPCTVQVTNLQTSLNAARGGAVLCLAPQSRHVGRFFVPARVAGDTGWIVVRTAPSASLGSGRVRPSQAASLAKLVSPNTSAALEVVAYARQTLILGVEITSDSALTAGPNQLVVIGGFGAQGGSETSVAQLPTDIVFDRVYAHGWAHQDVRRAFGANGAAQTFVRSWCEEIHQFNADSQCIAAWNSPGPILIEDNHLSAASENITTGGSDPAIAGVFAKDVTIRRNHLFKPDSWLTGTNWNVKNIFESKAVQRLLIENNVFDGNWFGAAPGHAAIVLKSTNPNGGCRQCYTSDVTIRRNLFQRIGVWLSLAGRADAGVGAPPSDSTNHRIALIENYSDSLSVAPYTNQNRNNITFVAGNIDVWIERNTLGGAGPTLEGAMVFGLDASPPPPVTNLTMRDNIFPKGIYGMGASAIGEGDKAWKAGTASGTAVWSNNAMLGSSTVVYPAGTTWHNTLVSALGVAGVPRATVAAGTAGVVIPR